MGARPTVFFLHGLGCSARLWNEVVGILGEELDCVALDMPGHGDAADCAELTVEQMAQWLSREVSARRPRSWALVGHSMGGKIATIVTARAEIGLLGLAPPLGLVLVSSSPLDVEPMDDAVRATMISWCEHGPVSGPDASTFVDANTATSLPSPLRERAVADVQRVSRTAWLAWLERGSLENWREEFPPLRTPTLVIAGADDGPLGVEGQRSLTLPRVSANHVEVVDQAAHLIALEQPQQLATLISRHLAGLRDQQAALPAQFAQLINSERVSARTRSILLDRLTEPAGEGVLDDRQRSTLAALLDRVIPQRRTAIDLAGRIDARLASGAGDGWRFAELPPDAEAWRRGLDTLLAARPDFAGLDTADQADCVEALMAGEIGSNQPGHLSTGQMTLWFEDVRAEAIRTWLAHPSALAQIGYDGFANGGDGRRKQGFLRVGAGERESWQRDLAEPVDGVT